VARPADLFEDPHLLAGGCLLDVLMPNGARTPLPRLSLEFGGRRSGLCRQPPRLGEHTREVLADLGLGAEEVTALERRGIVVAEDRAT
jgi:crotonobetainyl-CoA:carnitine CoA-transferase CaiB-like acyl-CoA transferase